MAGTYPPQEIPARPLRTLLQAALRRVSQLRGAQIKLEAEAERTVADVLEEVEADLGRLTGSVHKLTGTIGGLDGRLVKAEAEMLTLRQQVAALCTWRASLTGAR